jgi:PhoH-like ATPase
MPTRQSETRKRKNGFVTGQKNQSIQPEARNFGNGLQSKPEGRKNLIFLPDTNVLITDPDVLFKLEEHDVLMGWTVLNELDRRKIIKGKKEEDEEDARNSRKVARIINHLAHSVPFDQLSRGVRLERPGKKGKRKKVGRLYFNKPPKKNEFESGYIFDPDKGDHRILHECLEFMDKESRRTGVKRTLILLSKDKNMRTAALALGIRAEDYRNDAPSEESLRSTGMHYFPLRMLRVRGLQKGVLPRPIAFQDGKAQYVLQSQAFEHVVPYEFLIFGPKEEPENQRQYVVIEKQSHSTLVVRELRDYQYTNKVFYLHARNAGQNCFLNAMLHLRSELIIGEGEAGTGKTLLALAGAYEQIKEGVRKRVLITRDAVETGEKIGYLPGTLENKVRHFLPGFESNQAKLIRALDKEIAEKRKAKPLPEPTSSPEASKPKTRRQKRQKNGVSGENFSSDTPEVLKLIRLKEKLMSYATCIVSVGHLRGANLEENEIAIIDEAQHTDSKQGKMYGTRVVGKGQLILIGNTEQDDIGIPLRKSGLAKLIDATKGTDLMSLVTLTDVERGRLSERINKFYK